jgi:nucleoside-diphosphate-sugar epimerase
VTGGGGFLGQAICKRLIEREYEVLSFNRGLYPALAALGVRQIQGDLVNFEALCTACEGVDAVFHVGAKAGAWGSFQEYFDANVRGTRHLLAACGMNEVRTLVYTSTPSVTHRATQPVVGGHERNALPADGFKAWYPATKRVAEEAVLAANGPQLATVALRPRLIWGPGDNQLLPRLVQRAQRGRLRLVGDGQNKIDTTFIDNAVQAHLDAFDALHGKPDARCAGKPYFISNGEPKTATEIINSLLRAAGHPTHPISRRVLVGRSARAGLQRAAVQGRTDDDALSGGAVEHHPLLRHQRRAPRLRLPTQGQRDRRIEAPQRLVSQPTGLSAPLDTGQVDNPN